MTYGTNGVSAYTREMFICQLPKRERLQWYRMIKKALIYYGTYTTENIIECLSEKIKDLNVYALVEEKYDCF